MRSAVLILTGGLLLASCGATEGSAGDEITTTTELPPTTVQVTTTVSAEQLAKAQSVGDIDAGEELFYTELDWIPHDLSCANCHSLDGVDARSPSLAGISQVAGERIEGVSDIEYLRQSITDPSAFRAGDWPVSMPYQYGDNLTEEQVDDLVAFLLTR